MNWMKPRIWIDGKLVEFTTAHIQLYGEDGNHVLISLAAPEAMSSVRVKLVDRDGDIVTETPVNEKRWRQIAKEG